MNTKQHNDQVAPYAKPQRVVPSGTKVDLKKRLSYLYNPPVTEVTVVEVPTMQFLMIDGAGDPNTAQEYQEAVEALYGVAYALKFLLKKNRGWTIR